MKIRDAHLKINPRILKIDFTNRSKWYLFVYLLIAIFTNSYSVLFILILSFLDLIFNVQFFPLLCLLVFILLSISIEETLHIISALVLEKEDAVIGVSIRALRLFNVPIICCGAAVRFTKSKVSELEHALIAFGGAFGSLLCSCLLLLVLSNIWGFKPLFAFSLLITPIVSLLPSHYKGFVSDGYIVLCQIKANKSIQPFLTFMKRMLKYCAAKHA